jgi:hypothetical protein
MPPKSSLFVTLSTLAFGLGGPAPDANAQSQRLDVICEEYRAMSPAELAAIAADESDPRHLIAQECLALLVEPAQIDDEEFDQDDGRDDDAGPGPGPY